MWLEWNPSVECSDLEKRTLKLCKKQKLWAFLRLHRHTLIDEEVRADLAGMYATGSRRGADSIAPERLALAMVLQVAFHVPDHEVPTLTVVDRRWQMVLDCMGAEAPVMSQGTVFSFRERVRQSGFMDRLLMKTVALARQTGGFSATRLRTLIDSSPLLGAGRVEDTFNLIGRALAKLVKVAAKESGRRPKDIADELALSVVAASSVKAALDLDWRESSARTEALDELLGQFERLVRWLGEQFTADELAQPPLGEALAVVKRLIDQDTVPDPEPPTKRLAADDGDDRSEVADDKEPNSSEPVGSTTSEGASRRVLRQGTVDNRQISLSDPDMRHGRKSKSKRFNGYKRHIAMDAGVPGLILAVELLPANRCEHDAAEPLVRRLEGQGFELEELHVDRGYLAASVVHDLRSRGTEVITKPPAPRHGERFTKYDFVFDAAKQTLTCPEGTTIGYRGDGATHRFPTPICRACPRRIHTAAASTAGHCIG